MKKLIIKISIVALLLIVASLIYSLLNPGQSSFLDKLRLGMQEEIMVTTGDMVIGEDILNEDGEVIEGGHVINLEDLDHFVDIFQTGDILFTNSEKYLTSEMIAGDWKHALYYIGTSKQVIESFGEESDVFKKLQPYYKSGDENLIIDSSSYGVKIRELKDISNLEEISYLLQLVAYRVNSDYDIEKIVSFALDQEGKKYDFDMVEENDRLYCSELIYESLKHGEFELETTEVLSRETISPDDLVNQFTNKILLGDITQLLFLEKKDYALYNLVGLKQHSTKINSSNSTTQQYSNHTPIASEYYGEYHGLLATKFLNKKEIKNDFVGTYAEIITEDSNMMTLEFGEGFTASFYTNAYLELGNTKYYPDFIEFSSQNYHADIQKFTDLLVELQLTDKYLLSNPYYNNEKEALEALISEQKTETLTPLTQKESLNFPENTILLNTYTNIEMGLTTLEKYKFSYIALGNVSQSQQKNINKYLRAPVGGQNFIDVKGELNQYASHMSSDNNSLIQILDFAKQQAIPVFALETKNESYSLYGYSDTQMGVGVRNKLWTEVLPKQGKGILFADEKHFSNEKAINFQDYMRTKSKHINFYVQ